MKESMIPAAVLPPDDAGNHHEGKETIRLPQGQAGRKRQGGWVPPLPPGLMARKSAQRA
ncbi:MAG: hypothetical protein ACOX62_10010 [Christensenellales bacterium]